MLLDINVWLALYSSRHVHHQQANRWYRSLAPAPLLCFCRLTQLSFFRLLSTSIVMEGNPLDQQACWQLYSLWIDSGQAILLDEPRGLGTALRALTNSPLVTPKLWADAYLAAFATAAQVSLVTFDRALAERAPGSILLI